MSDVRPVAEWLPYFRAFTDAQILNPRYALHAGANGGAWCKLCDRPIDGATGEAHLEQHARDLTAHRAQQRASALQAARRARLA